jgi:hypothetical protein
VGARSVSDDEDLVGLWDSTPFDYGVMESSQLGLFADGTGWGVWSNFGGGMEVTLLTWRCPHMGVLEIMRQELISGLWEAGRPGQIVSTEPPRVLNTTSRFRYELVREHPPLGDEPVRALKLDRTLLFTTVYALVRHTISEADVPTIVHRDA